MKIILIALMLLLMPVTCNAVYNPIDHAGDTIRRQTNNAIDDTISKVRIEAHEAQKEMVKTTKEFIKWLLGAILEIVTIVGIGYILSYLVPKRTGIFMFVVAVLCAFNHFLRMFV